MKHVFSVAGLGLATAFVVVFFTGRIDSKHLTVVAPRVGTILLSALVAHTAWHWTTERWDRLAQYEWPTIGPVPLLWFVRILIVLVAAGAIAWLIAVNLRRKSSAT